MKPFQVGDRVSWCGKKGTINHISNRIYSDFKIDVIFDNHPNTRIFSFTEDGRFIKGFPLCPKLKRLVKRKKKKKC